jgi:hypothetical protein
VSDPRSRRPRTLTRLALIATAVLAACGRAPAPAALESAALENTALEPAAVARPAARILGRPGGARAALATLRTARAGTLRVSLLEWPAGPALANAETPVPAGARTTRLVATAPAGPSLAARLCAEAEFAPRAAETRSTRTCDGDATRDALLALSAGLLYPSESDRPFEWWAAPNGPAPAALPSAAAFAALIGEAPDLVTREDAGAFFARRTRLEPWMDEGQREFATRFAAVERALRAAYRDVAVYRAGRVEVRVFIVGLDRYGLSGLQTVSVET